MSFGRDYFQDFPVTIGVFWILKIMCYFSGSKTSVIKKICRQREVIMLGRKADFQLSKSWIYSSVENGSSHEYIMKLN